MDRLEAIMNKQRELQERLGTNFATLTDEERADFMRNHRGYLADEVAEALYEMPNYKLWKNYDNMSEEARNVAWQKVRMELVDSLHFFVNLLLCAGFTANELYEMYMAKNAENHRRQDEGYTAEVSYRDQAVEDVMGPRCTVSGNNTYSSDDFVAVMFTDSNHAVMCNSLDIVRLGLASLQLSKSFITQVDELSEEDAKDVWDTINSITGTVEEVATYE